jgi:hypothetical protein
MRVTYPLGSRHPALMHPPVENDKNNDNYYVAPHSFRNTLNHVLRYNLNLKYEYVVANINLSCEQNS